GHCIDCMPTTRAAGLRSVTKGLVVCCAPVIYQMVAIVIGSITALASRVLASSADWTLALQGHIAEIVILIGRAIRPGNGSKPVPVIVRVSGCFVYASPAYQVVRHRTELASIVSVSDIVKTPGDCHGFQTKVACPIPNGYRATRQVLSLRLPRSVEIRHSQQIELPGRVHHVAV